MSATTLGVCLALATTPVSDIRFVATNEFTLAWTHSIEKVRWEEDYRIEAPHSVQNSSAAPRLIAGQARIHGSAAGMEPPPAARLENGRYTYQPQQPPEPVLRLTRSPYAADYEWCIKGRCIPMGTILPSDGGVTLLYACHRPAETP